MSIFPNKTFLLRKIVKSEPETGVPILWMYYPPAVRRLSAGGMRALCGGVRGWGSGQLLIVGFVCLQRVLDMPDELVPRRKRICLLDAGDDAIPLTDTFVAAIDAPACLHADPKHIEKIIYPKGEKKNDV